VVLPRAVPLINLTNAHSATYFEGALRRHSAFPIASCGRRASTLLAAEAAV
jgi:hypothetical protein